MGRFDGIVAKLRLEEMNPMLHRELEDLLHAEGMHGRGRSSGPSRTAVQAPSRKLDPETVAASPPR